jgi:hypothetical protein
MDLLQPAHRSSPPPSSSLECVRAHSCLRSSDPAHDGRREMGRCESITRTRERRLCRMVAAARIGEEQPGYSMVLAAILGDIHNAFLPSRLTTTDRRRHHRRQHGRKDRVTYNIGRAYRWRRYTQAFHPVGMAAYVARTPPDRLSSSPSRGSRIASLPEDLIHVSIRLGDLPSASAVAMPRAWVVEPCRRIATAGELFRDFLSSLLHLRQQAVQARKETRDCRSVDHEAAPPAKKGGLESALGNPAFGETGRDFVRSSLSQGEGGRPVRGCWKASRSLLLSRVEAPSSMLSPPQRMDRYVHSYDSCSFWHNTGHTISPARQR